MFEKNRSVRIFIGLCIIIAIYLVCSGTLFDRDSGNNLRGELNRIGVQQRDALHNTEQAGSGINEAARLTEQAVKDSESIAIGIENLKGELGNSKEIIADSQRRIKQCLAIVQEAKRKGSND